MRNQSISYAFFIVAYWHERRLKKKTAGLIRIFELADNLKSLGQEVTLILPKIGSPRKQTCARVIEIPFIDLPLLRPLSFHLLSSLVLLILPAHRADFFYVRQMNSFLPLMIAKIFKKYTIFEIPNDPFLSYSSYSKIKRYAVEWIDNICMSLADKIVVLSEWSKIRLNRLAGIPLSKLKVVPSGTDTDLFRPLNKVDCCKQLKLDPSKAYVGFIGSFLNHQGIDILIDAAPIVLNQHRRVRFLLTGDGPMMESWKNMVTRKSLADFFIFTGQVLYPKVPLYLGAMDICVAPHRQKTNQASPVKLFDYMACGKPIVASNIESVREVIAQSNCALLVSPEQPHKLAEGINELLENANKRRQMGKAGRNWAVLNHDRKKIVNDMLGEMLSLMESSDKGK